MLRQLHVLHVKQAPTILGTYKKRVIHAKKERIRTKANLLTVKPAILGGRHLLKQNTLVNRVLLVSIKQ